MQKEPQRWCVVSDSILGVFGLICCLLFVVIFSTLLSTAIYGLDGGGFSIKESVLLMVASGMGGIVSVAGVFYFYSRI